VSSVVWSRPELRRFEWQGWAIVPAPPQPHRNRTERWHLMRPASGLFMGEYLALGEAKAAAERLQQRKVFP
jgi:hypothetical protein